MARVVNLEKQMNSTVIQKGDTTIQKGNITGFENQKIDFIKMERGSYI